MAGNSGLGNDGRDDVHDDEERRKTQIPWIGDDADRAAAKRVVGREEEEGGAAKTAIADVNGASLREIQRRNFSEADSGFGEGLPDEELALPLDDHRGEGVV